MLIRGLPAGCRFRREYGGDGAWSAEEHAIHAEGQRVVAATLLGAGAKKSQVPEPLKPPSEGWMREAREKEERRTRKAERWVRRQAMRSS